MANTTGDAILNLVYDAVNKLLNVNVSGITGSGMATEAKQDDIITTLGSPSQAGEAAAAAATLATEATAATLALESGGNLDTLAAVDYATETTQATLSLESGGNLATVKTNTDPLVTAGGGGYVRQDSTATIAKETGGNLASVKTNTDPLVASGGGGYIRQDSTSTIAKESGGNLASIKTNTDPIGSGATPYFDSNADNSAQAMKAGAGKLYKLHVINSNAADAYVQLFDVASGSVVVGTTTPNYVVFVPAEGAVIEDFNPVGMAFSTAITYAATTTATGAGDPAVGLTLSAAYI